MKTLAIPWLVMLLAPFGAEIATISPISLIATSSPKWSKSAAAPLEGGTGGMSLVMSWPICVQFWALTWGKEKKVKTNEIRKTLIKKILIHSLS